MMNPMARHRVGSSRIAKSVQGQAMVEFICVLVPLLLLILGTIQFALIYQAKITLNYAAFETARAGSLTGARMLFMENAFSRALAPLYTNPFWAQGSGMDDCTNNYGVAPEIDWLDDSAATDGPAAASLPLTIDHAECGRARVRQMINDELARIVLINPSTASFEDFGEEFELVREYDPSGDGHLSSRRTIPNDNLMYRDARPGANSEQSIQDANLIKTHVSLCFDLIVPIVSNVIGELMTNPTVDLDTLEPRVGGGLYNRWGYVQLDDATFGANCADSGGIPLYAHSIMRMHSPAVEELERCRGWCG